MRLPFLYSYKLSGQVLDEVKDSKYLGVTISDNLDWFKHITTTTTKANARLSFIILFYKIINNLAVVPHSCLEKADVRTRKKHSQKFRHIGYNIDPYGQLFFPNCISAWNGLAKDIAEANTLDIFNSKLQN